MAKNVDDLTLKVNVEGQTSLDTLDDRLKNIDKSTADASNRLKQFNVRNVAYQIQDLSVQLSMGTSAFIAIGQQLPQLLSGFGVMGAVIGAVAAVAIPLLQKGLEMVGYDFRTLNQRISELTANTKEFQAAQQANQPTLEGLRSTYGSLSGVAKEFFSVQEELKKQKVFAETNASVTELQKQFRTLYPDLKAIRDGMGALGDAGVGVTMIQREFDLWQLGLTAEQAKELGTRIRELDPKNPEKLAENINGILKYLQEAGPEVDKFRARFTDLVEPLMKINEQILEQKKNIRAAAEEASKLGTDLLNLQNKYLPDINAAKRVNDQIKALQIEKAMKIDELERNLQDKRNKGTISEEFLKSESAAGRLRIEQEIADKSADFRKNQSEAFRSINLSNDAKKRQIDLESQILGLQESGKLSALNALQFNEDLLRNAHNYTEALRAVDEQRRKNNITVEQQKKLETEAAEIKAKADDIAYQAMMKRQSDFIATQEQLIKQDERRFEVFKRTLTMSDAQRKNAEALASIEEERYKQLQGLESLNDPILRLVKEKEINDIYDRRIEKIKEQQDAELELSRRFDVGWERALNNYVDNATNAARQAENIFNKFTSSMEDMLVNLFKTGKLGWRDFLQTMIDQLMRSQVQQLLAKTFGSIGTIGGKSSSGGLFGGALIPGFLAEGGPANANQPYIVGERGPELFVPNSTGTVVPNDALGGGTSVVYNINAVDAMSFKQMLAADPTFLHAVAEQGRRRMPGAR